MKSYVYDKESFAKKESNDVFVDIYKSGYWGNIKSGGGSSLDSTELIRKALPEVFREFAINSMLDIPCGDYNWMKTVERPFIYIGCDIVDEIVRINQKLFASDKHSFRKLNIVEDSLPTVDLIFCRDCLQHLSYKNIKKALNNIKESNSKYLLVTSYRKTLRNYDIIDGDYSPMNLRKAPFGFPKPMLKIKENVSVYEDDKTMYFYKISDIPRM